jgi:hypothetical protein
LPKQTACLSIQQTMRIMMGIAIAEIIPWIVSLMARQKQSPVANVILIQPIKLKGPQHVHVNTMKSKSGSAEHNTIIDLVMVVLVVAVLLFVMAAIYKLLAPSSSEYTASKNNFESLVKQLKSLPSGESRQIPVYINKNYFVIGFNENQLRFDSACSMPMKVVIQRPGSCTRQCLCLCSMDDGCSKSGYCRDIGEKFSWQGGMGCDLALIAGNEKPQTATIQKSGSSVIIFATPPKQ